MARTKTNVGGRPEGRGDNPMNKRVRTETDAAIKARVKKTAETRKANEESKRAAAAKDRTEKRKSVLQSFFTGRVSKGSGAATTTTTTTNVAEETETAATTTNNQTEGSSGGREEGEAAATTTTTTTTNTNTTTAVDNDDIPTIDNEVPTIKRTHDIIANLDIDEDVRPEDHYDYDDGFEEVKNGKPLGLQQSVVKLIQERLSEEVRETNKCADTWLLIHLKENGWWIRKEHARRFAKKLGLNRKAPMAYYRDIYVFLPDIKYGSECKPCCPSCKQRKGVGNNGFRKNHFGRLIVGMDTTYYVITRQYRCYDCERKRNDLCGSTAIEAALRESGVSVEKTVDKLEYTFMAWDKRIIPLYPYGIGMDFPAILTWRAGVDKLVVAMMRPLFNKGVKPAQFANMLLELHTAEYDRLRLLHEYKIKSIRDGAQANAKIEPLGEFSDPNRNRGVVFSSQYAQHLYVEQHWSIRAHLDKEVKKRGAESLHWDASFKESGNLSQCHGKPIFSGLITALNEAGEIRIHFHFCTESHEEMQTALQAFERTRKSLGFPGVRHVYVDNPRGDTNLFLDNLPSVKEQQERYNSGVEPQTNASIPFYPFEKLKVRKADAAPDMQMVVNAMKEDIGPQRRVGLDTEWNRILRPNGMQKGRSRLQWIQLAYRDKEDSIQVLLLWVGNLKTLPESLQSLLCDDTLIFAGNKVSTDLKYIGEDFKIDRIRSVDQNERENVINIGLHGRKRDVTTTGNVGLDTLAPLTLNLAVDKSQQISTWKKDLSTEQEKYIAIDAAVSLEIFEALEKLPDLTRRLTAKEATIGRKVDLLPRNGNITAACMATRGATGTIVECCNYSCPQGFLLDTRRGNVRTVRVGKGTFVVRINNIYSPGMIIPKYLKRNSASNEVTLEDLGETDIILPLSMLKEHVPCNHFRPTPIHPRVTGRSQPVTTESTQRKSGRGQVKRKHSPADGYESDDSRSSDDDDELDDEFSEAQIEEDMKTLTPEHIKLLRAAIFASEEIQDGKVPLQHDKLEDPPKPEDILNRFAAVLGDPFHEMDRPNPSSTKHEFKKAYFVALREAMYIWNPVTYLKLHSRMKASGMSDDEIEKQKYYNARMFRECVDRIIPPPRILYYRLRAVFVLFGDKVDSKTKLPLFNKDAWNKANGVLKEARDGLFSDPPDIVLYSFKLGPNGEVMKNKYGLEKLKCRRGTNRVEACHKHISVTFKSWHVGHEMSNCLMGEFRHRWNHNVAEKNRYGFPKIGHYNTWVIDQLQNLMMENHGTQSYPHWTNASDFRSTDESFDTIPLHRDTLQEALDERCKELDTIKLTREQAFIAKSMGVQLPFLPVVNTEEKKAFAKLVLNGKGAIDWDIAAVEWCKYVDGNRIMPKLPSQLRSHHKAWARKMRIQESLKEAIPGIKLLGELNRQLTVLPPANTTNIVMEDAPNDDANNETGGDTNEGMQATSWNQPSMPVPHPRPPAQALQHTAETNVVCGIIVGKYPSTDSSKKRKPRRCGVCREEGCKGSGGRIHCTLVKSNNEKKTKSGNGGISGDGSLLPQQPQRLCQLCVNFGKGTHPNCTSGHGNRNYCKYYFRDGRSK